MVRSVVSAALCAAALARAAGAAPAQSPLLTCLEPIARAYHVRIVDASGSRDPIACVATAPHATLDATLNRLLQPHGLAWRRLDDGTLEVFAAPPASVQLAPLDIEGEPLPEPQRPEHPLATPLVERATASTVLDQQWLGDAPLLGFNQIALYAPNVYGSGQGLAIRGTERDTDYFPALTVTYDGIDLGTRLLDDELVPLDDVVALELARGPRAFEAGEGAQAGVIAMKTAEPAAQPSESALLGVGTGDERQAGLSWSGPLPLLPGLGATIAFEQRNLPSFVHQAVVPSGNVATRRDAFGHMKVRYLPEWLPGLSAEVSALVLNGDSSDRQVVPPLPTFHNPHPVFNPFDRESFATDPLVAETNARGAAGYVRYDASDWTLDAHASVTSITRNTTEEPVRLVWSDRELRRREGLTATANPWTDWTFVAGVEHDNVATTFYTPLSSGQLVFNFFGTETDSAALWAEHNFGSTWIVGLGLRALYERSTIFNGSGPPFGYHLPIPLGVVEWHPWSSQVFTLSYGTGFRSGGELNNATVVYSPERSQNAELSWRGKWFGDRLRTTTTVFAGKLRDRFTFDLAGPVSGPIPGSVRERGVEFEFDADLSARWRLRGGLGLLRSRFSSFDFLYGQPTSEAPPQTMTLGLRYGLNTGWYGAADAYHAGVARYYNPAGSLPAYEVLALRVGWRAPNWDAALIASNVLDKDYIARVQNSAENQIGFRLGDPRRVELRLKWSW